MKNLNRNHVVGGAPPSRRLTAWAAREGDWLATAFAHGSVNFLRPGKGAPLPLSDGLSRRDGGATTVSFRPQRLHECGVWKTRLIASVCAVFALAVFAADSDPASPRPTPPATPAAAPAAAPAKAPRTLGLKRQVNAGSRSGGAARIVLAGLAPSGLGLSSTSEPVLWWYLSEPSTNQVEFALNLGESFGTVLKADLPGPATAGLHSINLAQLAKERRVTLASGVPYEWTLRLRSGDDPVKQPNSIGWVEWVAPATEFSQKILATPTAQRAALFTAENYWYDAIHQLATDAAAGNGAANAQLQKLLAEVNLKEVRLRNAGQ